MSEKSFENFFVNVVWNVIYLVLEKGYQNIGWFKIIQMRIYKMVQVY